MIEIGWMLDPVPVAINGVRRGRPADVHSGIGHVGREHRKRIRKGQARVHDHPAPAQARDVREGDRSRWISTGSPQAAPGSPIQLPGRPAESTTGTRRLLELAGTVRGLGWYRVPRVEGRDTQPLA